MASADTADNADPPTLVATHLTKRFCDRQAVSDVSFQVDRGAAFGLLGPNGAGKTTTVRMLTGLVTPSGGSVSLFGELLTARNADVLRTRIGVQTDTNLYESLSVRDNLVTWGELYGLTSARLARRIDEVLEVLDLTVRLSKGMRQKLSVGRAVLHEPDLLFLDEPTAGLDPEAAEDLIAYVGAMIRATATSVVICTHQLHGLEQLCTDVGILDAGRLVVAGGVGELLRERWPHHRYTLAVHGDPARAEQVVSGLVERVERPAENAHLEFDVDDRATVSAVVEALVAERIPVRAVVPREPALHELYFATIVQRGTP